MLKLFSKFSLATKVKLLEQRMVQPLSDTDATAYERLDKCRIQGMIYAEKRCRKLRMGGIPWTPELTRIRLTIVVWMLVI